MSDFDKNFKISENSLSNIRGYLWYSQSKRKYIKIRDRNFKKRLLERS